MRAPTSRLIGCLIAFVWSLSSQAQADSDAELEISIPTLNLLAGPTLGDRFTLLTGLGISTHDYGRTEQSGDIQGQQGWSLRLPVELKFYFANPEPEILVAFLRVGGGYWFDSFDSTYASEWGGSRMHTNMHGVDLALGFGLHYFFTAAFAVSGALVARCRTILEGGGGSMSAGDLGLEFFETDSFDTSLSLSPQLGVVFRP